MRTAIILAACIITKAINENLFIRDNTVLLSFVIVAIFIDLHIYFKKEKQ